MSESPRLCPSCAGQLTANADTCPWCGAGTLGPREETKPGAPIPKVVSTRPDVGLGAAADRPLPPLPPPPLNRPFTKLKPEQVMLRTLIVLAIAYLLVTIGHDAIQKTLCAIPTRPFCP